MRLRRLPRFALGYLAGLLVCVALAGCAAAPPKPITVGLLPGEAPQGKIKLPNQWFLDPVGESRPLGDFPMNMRLSPDGRFLAVVHCGAGTHEVMVFATAGAKLISRTPLENIYYGVAFSPDGAKLFVSGGESEVVHVFAFANGFLGAPDAIRIAPEKERHVPCGIDVSRDGKLLAVAETWGNAVDIIDIASKKIVKQVKYPEESRPYDCKFDASARVVYLSLWGGAGVRRIHVDASAPDAALPTGDHPNEMLLSPDGKRLFVANANVNTVSVIDTAAWKVSETLNTALFPDAPGGSTPNALAVSPDGEQLFVANADNNAIAAFNIEEPGRSKAIGMIPVGWYPTSVRLSADGKTLYAANGKGLTPVANPQGPNPYVVKPPDRDAIVQDHFARYPVDPADPDRGTVRRVHPAGVRLRAVPEGSPTCGPRRPAVARFRPKSVGRRPSNIASTSSRRIAPTTRSSAICGKATATLDYACFPRNTRPTITRWPGITCCSTTSMSNRR